MQLPITLRGALEAEAARFKLAELARAHEAISSSYRAGAPPTRLTDVERVAYAVTRLPATYAACAAALGEVAARLAQAAPTVELTSLLDLGAGPGSMLWAAAEKLPALQKASLIDSDAGLADMGKRFSQEGEGVIRNAEWITSDLRSQQLHAHDLVTCSYSLGELPAADAASVLRVAWHAAGKLLVIIEPGTPAGFARVRGWRDQLLRLGAHMVAPCPHAGECPMAGSDWCHFAQRVERTSLHRRLKGGELGYEDEKFSYIAVSKSPVPLPPARIIRHPRVEAGAIQLELCAAEGLQKLVATKRQREQFRQARHARWGDSWESSGGYRQR